MNPFAESVAGAAQLVAGGDPELLHIVGLSLTVSGGASVIATALGLLAGAAVAVSRFRGRATLLVLLNTLLALPSVVVGLAVYLLLSRAGPLGALGILFTPTAMVVAQAILVTPIVAALARQVIEDALHDHGEQLRSLGAGRLESALIVAWDERLALSTLALVAFGRAVSEVGAVMIVGGNIAGVTRVMTTAIALETSKGDLPLALALGLVLLGVVLSLNVVIGLLRQWRLAEDQRWSALA
ncbi:ABC transporter permease [Ideonella sp.]|uniref:ABC transporter permease n=1 Tax=Ideonella sp. TaxID=1929293 RepID=UPI002B48B92B|nr:ABC transporter permease [Ideonella sp.]HJV70370.1 ABC transporter permease [Ideonella sp.]